MSLVLALDPSINSSGAALFSHGVLIATQRIVLHTDGEVGARCLQMAHAVAAWVISHKPSNAPSVLIHEWPQIYKAAKSKGDPNDLVALAGIGVGLAGILAMGAAARGQALEVRSPKPAEWAGQLPKATKGDPWKSPRAKRVALQLSPEERERVVRSHDVIDGVGIGLWYCGRFKPHRVLAGTV